MLKIRRKKLMNTKKQSVYLIALFFVSVFMGIGYSYLSSTLSLDGYARVYKSNWDVHFENIEVNPGSISNATSSIVDNSTTLNYQVPFSKPGEYYEFTVDVKNSGTIDAMIGSIVNSGITTEQSEYIEYNLEYTSGRSIKERDLLPAGSSDKLLIKVKIKDNIPASKIPTTEQVLNLTLNVNYIESEKVAAIKHPVCKRAKTLHKEVCGVRNSSANCNAEYTIGQDVIYGSLGTKGTLTSGDAFDCDVNGDKKYNPETERFYYTTDLDTDSNIALLIQSIATKQGEPTRFAFSQYDPANLPQVNGPVGLREDLPTTSQWSNVTLTTKTKRIQDELGNNYINFSYNGYAARIMTIQELERACNKSYSQLSGSSSYGAIAQSCLYILENGQYTWVTDSSNAHQDGNTDIMTFENVYSGDSTKIFYVSGWGRILGTQTASNNWYGVHPLIEVSKDKISY